MKFLHPVAIKPFLKRYLAYHCLVNPQFELTEKNRFGSYLINCLRFKTQVDPETLEYSLGGTPVTMYVSIPEYYERNFGIIISKRHQMRFNKFLLDEFHDRLVSYVHPQLTGRKGEIKMALLNFRLKYDISEDDLPYKTLEKMYERERYRATPCLSIA
jgi:hypothetical protein